MKKNIIWKWTKIVVAVIICCLAAYGVFWFIKPIIQKNVTGKTATLSQGFHNIGKLATQSNIIKEGKVIDDPRRVLNIPIPFTTTKGLITCTFDIKAGYNYENIDIIPNDDTKTVVVKLPPEEIISKDKLPKDTYEDIAYVDENIFNDFTADDNNAVVEELREKAIKVSLDNGMYDRAFENAKDLIWNNVVKQDSKYADYEFIWERTS